MEFDFFTFPVLFSFAAGALVGILLLPLLGGYAFLLALFGTSFGVFHLISSWARKRFAERRREREEEAERERRALAARSAAATDNERGSARRRRQRRA
ncbi:MAG TPA: hypothetical protein VNN21_02175 [Dehalococcoidia bacterium]|nr:hypothetical protein [Dehalococcoidia bacterium]